MVLNARDAYDTYTYVATLYISYRGSFLYDHNTIAGSYCAKIVAILPN